MERSVAGPEEEWVKKAQLEAGGAEVIRQSAQRGGGGGGGGDTRTPPKTSIQSEAAYRSCIFSASTLLQHPKYSDTADRQKQLGHASNDAPPNALPVRLLGVGSVHGGELFSAPACLSPAAHHPAVEPLITCLSNRAPAACRRLSLRLSRALAASSVTPELNL